MKKVKKIVGLVVVWIFVFYSTCYADVIMGNEKSSGHGSRNFNNTDYSYIGEEFLSLFTIGILILILVSFCIFCIVFMIKNKKEKQNDNK